MSSLQKNTADQKWTVFAFDRTDNTPKEGDAAQITGKISKDWGSATAITDTNPTEIEDGYYVFDLTQEETNADILLILPESSTSNIQVIGLPGTRSTIPIGFSDLNIGEGIVEANVKEINDVPVTGSSSTILGGTLESIQVYTSQTEIERIWSTIGAQYRTDDDGDGSAESGVWNDIIIAATDEVNIYVLKWYEPGNLINNLMVRRWASIIGAFLLSQRRGNPAQFQSEYERVLNFLEEVSSGNKRIPRLPMRDDFTPSMRNYTIDHRFHSTKIRTVRKIQTGGSYSGELKAPDRFNEPY